MKGGRKPSNVFLSGKGIDKIHASFLKIFPVAAGDVEAVDQGGGVHQIFHRRSVDSEGMGWK